MPREPRFVVAGRWASVEDVYELDMGEDALERQKAVSVGTPAPKPTPLQLFELETIARERRPSAKQLYEASRRRTP
jgi:hypothetical protein